jgi:hypothetical protein
VNAADLLTQAIARARPLIADTNKTPKVRLHLLWAAAKKARDLGAEDRVHAAFLALAVTSNLIDGHGRWTGSDIRQSVIRHGAADVSHVISWALRGRNPFEKGPLS